MKYENHARYSDELIMFARDGVLTVYSKDTEGLAYWMNYFATSEDWRDTHLQTPFPFMSLSENPYWWPTVVERGQHHLYGEVEEKGLGMPYQETLGPEHLGQAGDQADRSDPETAATPPWNPVAVDGLSFRQGEMLHAILGPALTEDLVRAVAASGLEGGTLAELTARLQELQVRKYPEMLLVMASAAHATARAAGFSHLEDEFPLLREGYGDAGKYFGDEIIQALRRFGVDPLADPENYKRWLQYAVEDESVDLHWHLRHPDIEEEESGTEVSAEMEHRPRRKPRLMDYVNRAAARSARSLADRIRSGRRGSPPESTT